MGLLFNRKQKLTLHAFTRLISQTIIKANALNLSELNNSILLTGEDKKKIVNELLYLRLTLFSFMLLEAGSFNGKKYTSKEIGKIVLISVILGFQDNGITEEEARKKADAFNARIGYYADLVAKTATSELEEKGVYFFLIKYFTNYVLDENAKMTADKLQDEKYMNRHFEIFNFGNQAYRLDKTNFDRIIRTVKEFGGHQTELLN